MNEHLKYDIDIAIVVEERDIAETSKLFCFYCFYYDDGITDSKKGLHRFIAIKIIVIRRGG